MGDRTRDRTLALALAPAVAAGLGAGCGGGGGPRRGASAIVWTARRPWRKAFLISPMPPSSPATHAAELAGDVDPGYVRLEARARTGSSTPASAVPRTRESAPTGQTSRQRPWPMQSAG